MKIRTSVVRSWAQQHVVPVTDKPATLVEIAIRVRRLREQLAREQSRPMMAYLQSQINRAEARL